MTKVMMTNDDDGDAGQTELVRGAARSISQVQKTTQLSCTFQGSSNLHSELNKTVKKSREQKNASLSLC